MLTDRDAAEFHDTKYPIFTGPQSASRGIPFLGGCHLLITTPSHIYAWDSTSIRSLFQSSKHSIVAAREAPNGSGVLAVADKHVVVLHDTKRGQEKSWGLGADTDEVRRLEYTADAKSLYVSTSLTPDIQRYSTELSRLLDPARAHASPPVALAISPTGRLMVSASDGPPVVYLQDIAHNGSPVLIEPRASRAAVAVASFHPERPNVFLLAFRDGAAAAYDATKIIRSRTGSVSNQECINKSEFCHLTSLHRAAPTGSKSIAITGAAFLPGFKWRAVTVGSDGKSRIVDFADGGVILRTWHAKAAVTSVSVLAIKTDTRARKRGQASTASHVIGGPTSTDSLIAIGRTDGEVLIYDSVGLLLTQGATGDTKERIISVEWMKGPSPEPIDATQVVPEIEESLQTMTTSESHSKSGSQAVRLQTGTASNSSTKSPLKKLRNGSASTKKPKSTPSHPTRRFTIHPDEAEEGTVRRVPVSDTQRVPRMITGDFQDLFSTSKVTHDKSDNDASPDCVTTPPRSRPTITSQTFVKSPEPGDPTQFDIMARRRNLALFPSTDSNPEITPPGHSVNKQGAGLGNDSSVSPSSKPTKRPTLKVNSTHPAHRRARFASSSFHPDQNTKTSPSLLESNMVGFSNMPNSAMTDHRLPDSTPDKLVLSATPRKKRRMRLFHRSADHIEIDADSETARETYELVHKRCNWPDDSNQESSAGGDGCVSSSLRKRSTGTRNSLPRITERPPARQTSHSRMNSNGTMSTARQAAQAEPLSPPPAQKIDGSTEEDVFVTADTHVTSSGTFSPSSKDMYELFPRSSSLSPRKGKRYGTQAKESTGSGTRHRKKHAPQQPHEIPSKSPWARARVLRSMENDARKSQSIVQSPPARPAADRVSATDGQTEDSAERECLDCHAMHAKVLALEGKVARLSTEVSAMKARLKRHRIPPIEANPTR